MNELWAQLTIEPSHNEAIIALARAPVAVRDMVMQRSANAAAAYDASPGGQAELEEMAGWRALRGEPFLDSPVIANTSGSPPDPDLDPL